MQQMPFATEFLDADTIESVGYELGDTLGIGRFSQVVRGTLLKTGEHVAVKIVDLESLAEDEEALDALEIEINVLKTARHPNIVSLHQVVNTPFATYVIMELVAGGELFERIVSTDGLPERQVRWLMKQLLEALAFCHRLGIVHRDLKPENILLDGDGPWPQLKLIDFGYAARLGAGESLSGLAGTPAYVAPEVLSWYSADGTPTEGVPYDSSADIWAVGVVMYTMLCGFPPFYDEDEAQLIDLVRAAELHFPHTQWRTVSREAVLLLTACLSLLPADRPTALSALSHAWLTSSDPDWLPNGGQDAHSTPAALVHDEASTSSTHTHHSSRSDLLSLEPKPLDPCVVHPAVVDQLQSLGCKYTRQLLAERRKTRREGFQLEFDSLGESQRFSSAPSTSELDQQQARYIRLPRALYDHIYLLCDAHRRGQLNHHDQKQFSALLASFVSQLDAGMSSNDS